MLVLLIIGVLLIFWIVFVIVEVKRDDEDMFFPGLILSFIHLIVLAVLVSSEVQWPRDIEMTRAKYSELKREVQQISELEEKECDLTVIIQKDLFEEVRKMNENIDKNRIYCTSPWVGLFYSEEIGNLEKINYRD